MREEHYLGPVIHTLKVYKPTEQNEEGRWYVDVDGDKPHSGFANGATLTEALDCAAEMLRIGLAPKQSTDGGKL